jgi:hypothetical protein
MVGLGGGRKQRLQRRALLLLADTIERPRDREGEMEPSGSHIRTDASG